MNTTIKFLNEIEAQAKKVTELASTYSKETQDWFAGTRPMLLAVDEATTDVSSAGYQMDMALLKAAQVAVVPKHSPFQRLQEDGHRFLITEDGMYLEVRRPWLYFTHRLVKQIDVVMPYGRIEPVTELNFGTDTRLSFALPLIKDFITKAKDAMPNETSDLLVWNSLTQELTDGNVLILNSTPGSVSYATRDIGDGESIAIDLHSHGKLNAFFSGTDNNDDAGSVKISGVIGSLDTDTPTAEFRLCVLGLYLPINVPHHFLFGAD